MAPVTSVDASETPPATSTPHPPLSPALPPLLVGREAELRQLHGWFAQARRGTRQVVFVTGEAGIGKTTVVEAFLANLAGDPALWLMWGQCLQHYGAGEAYLPVLDALGRLCRGPEGTHVLALLAQQAPTWLLQLPALLSATELEAAQRRALGATHERMLRELAETLEVLTAIRPLVLVLEDLHWSDTATLDLVAWLARRREPARLLLLGTYRPVDVIAHRHPLQAVKQDLSLHGQCAELRLASLPETAVAAYLAERFPGQALPPGLARALHRLAQRAATPTYLLEAHEALGTTLFYLGEFAAARTHLERGIALIDPAEQWALALRHSEAPGVRCLAMAALTLWCLGFPAQAERRSQEALALAQELAHLYSIAVAQFGAASLQHHRREVLAVQAQADALLSLARAQGFPVLMGYGTCWRGWALAMQGQGEAALAQLQQGLEAVLATGQTLAQPFGLLLHAEAMGHAGQGEAGLRLLAEALAACKDSGCSDVLAEVYRLQGELFLEAGGRGAGVGSPPAVEAEVCLHQALEIARRQQAKAWELRAALSLARLWQGQRKQAAARQLLAEVYG